MIRACSRVACFMSPHTGDMAGIVNAVTSQFQSPEKKKEEFRQYLERSGVIDALTKVLVGLYEEPEKPANAIE